MLGRIIKVSFDSLSSSLDADDLETFFKVYFNQAIYDDVICTDSDRPFTESGYFTIRYMAQSGH